MRNQSTILLGIDKRLYVDLNNKQAYKIISIDNTSHKGLIELIVEQDLIQNDSEHPDRPDLGICNYIEPTISVDPPQGDTYSTINATNMILGITNEITPTFYNSDGTINSTIVAVWNIIKPVGYESDITISTNGNICNISLSDNYDLLGKTVVATVSDGNGEYKSTTELTIGMGW
ncbi:MAG: hypothetical protein K0Q49_2468 [Haloplasmataceae bacterium]|nr:hypothetical protein [Haloplasmataceae bacterium]